MKVPIVDAYWKIRKSVEDPSTLSFRKQICLQYLKWGVYLEREDRDKFVDMAREWRKVENKVGKQRTLLERKARRLFSTVNTHRKLAPCREGARKWAEESKRKKIGVHHPDYVAKLAEHNRRIRRKAVEENKGGGIREWIVITPEGEEIFVRNLAKWCRENGLDDRHLGKCAYMPNRHHKGYKCRYFSPDWDKL